MGIVILLTKNTLLKILKTMEGFDMS